MLQLTSPDKMMTIEAWINELALRGERQLAMECDAMVSHFEAEGHRALRVLEAMDVS